MILDRGALQTTCWNARFLVDSPKKSKKGNKPGVFLRKYAKIPLFPCETADQTE